MSQRLFFLLLITDSGNTLSPILSKVITRTNNDLESIPKEHNFSDIVINL